jgi:uncharacterized protein (TIGR03435 family)
LYLISMAPNTAVTAIARMATTRRYTCTTIVFALAVSVVPAGGITQALVFEAVSVKPQTGLIGNAARSGGRYYEPGATARQLIEFAYDLTSIRVVGGPAWIDSERWEITATPPAPSAIDEMRLMVRALLLERFKLRPSFETRQLPVYELRVARDDGRLGSAATPAAPCTPIGNRSPEAVRLDRPTTNRACGSSALIGAGYISRRLRGVRMTVLAIELEKALKHVVIDRTGVSALLDIDLTYAVDTNVPQPTSLAGLARQPDAPALRTALQEQLGLKLESVEGPVDLLVVDSVERPAAN